MSLKLKALQFANLLEIAYLSAEDGDGYAMQEKLIKACRDEGAPFVAIMPMRHRFRCEICKVDRGESIYHFENPMVPDNREERDIMWGPAVGIWAQVETSELHNVLAHGEEPNKNLKRVLTSVSC